MAGVWLVRNAGVFFVRFCAGLALFSDNCREIPHYTSEAGDRLLLPVFIRGRQVINGLDVGNE